MSDFEQGSGRERRRHIRVQIVIEAMLELGSRPAQPCQVYNISVGGALVEHAAGARLGEATVLHLDDFGPVRGHVARISSTVMGVAFENCDAPALAAYIERRRKATLDSMSAPAATAASAPGA